MRADYHVHSAYSDDSWYEMETVVKDAIELGLTEICFTDHVDYGIKIDWDDPREPKTVQGFKLLNVDYPNYFAQIASLQEKYKGLICVKKGLEFGIQTHTIPLYEALFQRYPMDFVLLSIHQIKDQEFWTGEFQAGKTHAQCYQAYYQEMLDVITQFKNYSCLAHMDLLRRYLDVEVDAFESTKDQITQILKLVIKDGKGIEVNTSSVRYGVKGLTPSREILTLYHQLGGTIITIGSDAHQQDHLGFHIEESKQILREIGFKATCTFDNMVPIFHAL
ncbi:histidinol phosphate phosphatase [Erysipelothrix larvae]|uniref:Histidinol-phosphatase n=1 Tax=Erysipelothrix larvae TaxID=1514105 RepID=A0A0X8GYH2_9FIRM|nr:histidinol-phosphatase HisJ family protein [Erysipelothrix larvae]AMC92737.1 histidinol phosphate phosphatase [Erysipelothrix larvae]